MKSKLEPNREATAIRCYDDETVEILHRDVDCFHPEKGQRWLIVTSTENGYNHTLVDLLDVLEWVRKNQPELLQVLNV